MVKNVIDLKKITKVYKGAVDTQVLFGMDLAFKVYSEAGRLPTDPQ